MKRTSVIGISFAVLLAYVTVWAAGWDQFETIFRIFLIVLVFAVGGIYAIDYTQ